VSESESSDVDKGVHLKGCAPVLALPKMILVTAWHNVCNDMA